jgi:hypothetical protein
MIIWELGFKLYCGHGPYLMSSIVGIKVPSFIITAAGTAKIRAAINNNGPEVKKIKFTDGQRSFLKI